MIFHFGFELPVPVSPVLDSESPDLTGEETRILKEQIRKNSRLIDDYIDRLDLFVNKERYPRKEAFIEKIRRRLNLLMDENNTFRSVLWKHFQKQELSPLTLSR
ncbi:MAG: hypothetical protein HYZ84_05430 [Candidatus Omnitrophica bacterium]|nr:hypothetical protein [Candidatus Omnitrophota bacterium]